MRMQSVTCRSGDRSIDGVTDVAVSQVGYSSPSHFRDVFRQHFGTSPRRYLEEVTG